MIRTSFPTALLLLTSCAGMAMWNCEQGGPEQPQDSPAQSSQTLTVGQGMPFGDLGCRPLLGDFDGDNKADLACLTRNELAIRSSKPGNPIYLVQLNFDLHLEVIDAKAASINGTAPFVHKTYADVALTLGDRSTSQVFVAYFRDPILSSTVNVVDNTVPLGNPSPIFGDYDADGHTDIATYDWNLHGVKVQRWSGITDTVPLQSEVGSADAGASPLRVVSLDRDGDGRTDRAVFEGGYWTIRLSSSLWNSPPETSQFPTSGMSGVGSPVGSPVPADYDHDGKADLAFFDRGLWYIEGADAPIVFPVTGYALYPFAADIDGDGKADCTVFDTATSKWYSTAAL